MCQVHLGPLELVLLGLPGRLEQTVPPTHHVFYSVHQVICFTAFAHPWLDHCPSFRAFQRYNCTLQHCFVRMHLKFEDLSSHIHVGGMSLPCC